MNIFKFKTIFLLGSAFMIVAFSPASTSYAGCMNTKSPTAQALAKGDYQARAKMSIENAKHEAASKSPKSPYADCISKTTTDWSKFSNLLSMDAVIKMLRQKMQAVIDKACNSVRNVTSMPATMANGVIQNGVTKVNGAATSKINTALSPANTVVNGALGGVNNGAVKAGGNASQQANGIINGIIP